MEQKKRIGIPLMVFTLVMTIFLFTAYIEFQRTYEGHVKETEEKVATITANLEGLIASRMIAVSGLKAHIEINENFTQEDYAYFAEGIYGTQGNVIQGFTFITDTTISHVYPYEVSKSAIGVDLATEESQGKWVQYVKENLVPVINAPVNLVQGGVGIVVRQPILIRGDYYGQVSIVFNYEETLGASGLLDFSENHQVTLKHFDPLHQRNEIIWSNVHAGEHFSPEGTLEGRVDLLGTSLSLLAIPQGGFRGESVLFYLVLGIGFLVSAMASFSSYNLLKTTGALKVSEKELLENNTELEALIQQLRANEEELFSQYEEITEQRNHIRFLADSDYLTNLYNRRRFADDMAKRIRDRKEGTVLLFDIDNFKNINDSQGHSYGDQVLIHISQVLLQRMAKHVGVYRSGGDEFVLHLPDIVKEEEIQVYVEELFAAIKENNKIDQIQNLITISVGIAKYPEDSLSAEDLLMKADIAMYQAKKDGKNRYCYFTKDLNSNFDQYVRIERALQKALEEEDFQVVYQPLMDASGDIASFEALLRMGDHSLSPLEFIPVAENSGLMVPIGRYVLHEVARQLSVWKGQNLEVKPVAVNISARQVYEGNLLETVVEALEKYHLDPSLLEIEITESILIENSTFAIEELGALRKMGIAISLDDFGTGYSSLSYLTYMPVDKVKIDKTLKDRFLFLENEEVMRGMISLCHGLKLGVVTEGVETLEEVEKLRSFGSDYLQGYFFHKPKPAEKIGSLLKPKV